ncbi:hypothetical protein CKA32_004939 [Geitlerinema sp. FC II]|nr:hypothetical protein CKA32_004939 [Geitlerinema sp. FC II]
MQVSVFHTETYPLEWLRSSEISGQFQLTELLNNSAGGNSCLKLSFITEQTSLPYVD